MPWIPRGLRRGIVTTRYPRRPDGYGPGFRAAIVATGSWTDGGIRAAADACPTGAIVDAGGTLAVDRGRCILCGRCAELAPEAFAPDPAVETARSSRPLLVTAGDGDAGQVDQVRDELAAGVRTLRRSIYIRHVDAGSDGAVEWEVAALGNPVYDVQRLGIYFTASPKHADLLLVTGAGARAMEDAVRHTYDLLPTPKVVVAAGTDAISGGLFSDTYATRGGIGSLVPVDVYVPGSPPSPFALLHGILHAVGLLGAPDRARGTSGWSDR